MNKELFFKAVKEPLRLLILAVIPFAFTYLTEFDTQWAIGATVVLRFLDKWLHEIGKERSTKKVESKLVKGLVRF